MQENGLSYEVIADHIATVTTILSMRYMKYHQGTPERRMMCEGYLQAIALLLGIEVKKVRTTLANLLQDAGLTSPELISKAFTAHLN